MVVGDFYLIIFSDQYNKSPNCDYRELYISRHTSTTLNNWSAQVIDIVFINYVTINEVGFFKKNFKELYFRGISNQTKCILLYLLRHEKFGIMLALLGSF